MLSISAPTDNDDGVLKGCQGPTDFVEAMNKAYEKELGCSVHPGWKEVELVSASGENLGSLHAVRQAFELWDKQHKLWSIRQNPDTAGNA